MDTGQGRAGDGGSLAESEVKGSWFVVAREETLSSAGPEGWDAIVRSVPAVAEVVASAWYPEAYLAACLEVLEREVCRGDAARFEALLERAVERGFGRFFSAMLSVTTPGFVLARVPTMWRMLRRGAGEVTVTRTATGSRVDYRAFPRFGDARYVTLTRASLVALVRKSIGARPVVEIVFRSDDALSLNVDHR